MKAIEPGPEDITQEKWAQQKVNDYFLGERATFNPLRLARAFIAE